MQSLEGENEIFVTTSRIYFQNVLIFSNLLNCIISQGCSHYLKTLRNIFLAYLSRLYSLTKLQRE